MRGMSAAKEGGKRGYRIDLRWICFEFKICWYDPSHNFLPLDHRVKSQPSWLKYIERPGSVTFQFNCEKITGAPWPVRWTIAWPSVIELLFSEFPCQNFNAIFDKLQSIDNWGQMPKNFLTFCTRNKNNGQLFPPKTIYSSTPRIKHHESTPETT